LGAGYSPLFPPRSMPYRLSDFRADRISRIRPAVDAVVRRTPLRHSPSLSRATGRDVHLKCEGLQLTGSFKIRGAVAAVSQLPPDTSGVVTCSTGNHGNALTHAARLAGLDCTVVVPGGVAPVKEQKMKEAGARIIHAPPQGYDLTQDWTQEQLPELGGVWVSPFEDPWVVAGNGGTTGLEIFEDLPDVDTLVTPVGGGGLAAGLGQAVELLGRSGNLRLVGVNSVASPGMWRSRRDGRAHLHIESDATLADGIEGGVGELTYLLGNRYLADVVQVEEAALAEAVGRIHREEDLRIEGASATTVAALLQGLVGEGDRVVLVLTGSNIAPELHRSLLG
jgi:threonine dehydratase